MALRALRRRGALGARLAAVVFLAMVPAVVLAFFAIRDEREHARELAGADAELVVVSVAGRYGALIDQTELLLETLTTVPAVAAADALCEPRLQALVAANPAYDDVLVVRTDGRVECAARADAATDVSGEPWFREALEAPGFRVGRQPPLVATVTTTDANGRPDRVLAARLALERTGPVVGRVGGDVVLAVVGPDGTVWHHEPDTDLIGMQFPEEDVLRTLRTQPDERTVVMRARDGTRRAYAERTLPSIEGTSVVAGLTTDAAFAEASDRFRDYVLALALAALFALAAALGVAHLTITRRVRRLLGLTQRIASGDLTARADARANDEIGRLARSFDAMAAELERHEAARRELVAAVVEAGERERRRIASDAHDDAVQVMSAHVMGLQVLKRRVDDPELRARIEELEGSARTATARLRDLVFELQPPMLAERGLAAALDVLLARTFEGTDVETALAADVASDPPPAVRDTAYRIAQEAVVNARRHAEAGRVEVHLGHEDGYLVLRVADNGRGVARDVDTSRPGHLGLAVARERAAVVGGGFTMQPRVGGGTVVECRLPWNTSGNGAPSR